MVTLVRIGRLTHLSDSDSDHYSPRAPILLSVQHAYSMRLRPDIRRRWKEGRRRGPRCAARRPLLSAVMRWEGFGEKSSMESRYQGFWRSTILQHQQSLSSKMRNVSSLLGICSGLDRRRRNHSELTFERVPIGKAATRERRSKINLIPFQTIPPGFLNTLTFCVFQARKVSSFTCLPLSLA